MTGRIKFHAMLLLATVLMCGCGDDYDDAALRKDVNDLKSRVEKLESWCATTNTQISALQGLVSVLEQKDFVTGVTPVTEGTETVGYTITFTKSDPITIMHGKDGAQGEAGKDGVTPIIGVKQDIDSHYYWTIKIGDAPVTWMTDVNGNKISATGEDGQPGTPGNDGNSPVLSVAEFEGSLYWQVDGEWLLNDDQKVPATGTAGSKGDAIFAEDGIDYTSNPENVIFTLADGVTKITLPKASSVSIGFGSYDTFYCSETANEIALVLPSTLKETDYNAIVATITSGSGTDMDIQTRSAATASAWGVKVTKPSFAAGLVVANSAKVTLTLPQDKTDYKALLKVTIIDSKGKEFSVSRIVWFKADQDANVIDNTTGDLSAKIANPGNVKQLSVIGSVSANDFQYIRENLTSIEVLDLSRATITELPEKAMAFYDLKNSSLRTVILPETLTSIGNSVFAMCLNLREINIPKNVRTLGKWMFEGCASLETIEMPQGITDIPASAFYGCGIISIELPTSVTSIGEYAFSTCKRLESANVPAGVTVINEGVFYECGNLQSVKWHDNITSIGEDAFMNCAKFFNGKNLVIPSKVTSIGSRAFSLTRITSLKLPEGLLAIGSSAFNYCAISTIDLPSTITSLHAVAFQWSTATTVICRSITPPEIELLDDHNNPFSPFDQIGASCVLKKPAGANYSTWNSYFKGGIQDL